MHSTLDITIYFCFNSSNYLSGDGNVILFKICVSKSDKITIRQEALCNNRLIDQQLGADNYISLLLNGSISQIIDWLIATGSVNTQFTKVRQGLTGSAGVTTHTSTHRWVAHVRCMKSRATDRVKTHIAPAQLPPVNQTATVQATNSGEPSLSH